VQSTSGRAVEKLDFQLSNSSGSFFDAALPGNAPSLLGQISHRFFADSGIKVRVSAVDNDAYGSYRIVVIPIDTRPEHASPVLTYGDTITEAIDYRRDLDEFTIGGAPGDSVIIFVQALSPDTTQRLRVMAPGLVESTPAAIGADISIMVAPGRPLRVTGTPLARIPQNGVYKISVNGATGIAADDNYIGSYRLVVAKVSGAPESANPVLQLNSIIVETGDPPRETDRFLLPAAPGK